MESADGGDGTLGPTMDDRHPVLKIQKVYCPPQMIHSPEIGFNTGQPNGREGHGDDKARDTTP